MRPNLKTLHKHARPMCTHILRALYDEHATMTALYSLFRDINVSYATITSERRRKTRIKFGATSSAAIQKAEGEPQKIIKRSRLLLEFSDAGPKSPEKHGILLQNYRSCDGEKFLPDMWY